MAKMHKIPLNENEEPFIFAKMRQFLNNLPKKYTCETKNLIFQKYFESNDLVEQFEHLRQILSELNTPVVFCHNDLLVNNILYDKNNGKQLKSPFFLSPQKSPFFSAEKLLLLAS